MQLHHANTLERIEGIADHGSGEVGPPLVTLDQLDFSTCNRDEVLALLAPSGHLKPTIWLVVVALAGGLGLGWAGAWYGPATISALNRVARIETASRRMPDANSGVKAETARKIASASGSRTPPGLDQPSTVSASVAPKPLAKASSEAQSAGASYAASSVVEANVSVTGSVEPAGRLLSVPEARPTTIRGWAVLDVRDGMAVLERPDRIRIAARGDVVPGIGRIDSIVRWGNRWIAQQLVD
ncbi:hypothetical protein FXB41_40445 [Bradyrhizobium canariense]|uniref:hypothetical protein n=1 Tax=Bradyrhizobium canariense TaxID=255045 RepID=UPI001CA5D01D|nr:hypothetical protein [Bradyrhizobium canariense]MBW5440790.1 hypothetical protein [Bradyrhizobium canariense]